MLGLLIPLMLLLRDAIGSADYVVNVVIVIVVVVTVTTAAVVFCTVIVIVIVIAIVAVTATVILWKVENKVARVTGITTERAIVVAVYMEIFVVGVHVAPSYGTQFLLVFYVSYRMTTIVASGDVM